MKIDKDRLDELMANAREAFVYELKDMVNRINSLVMDCPYSLMQSDIREILIFFHKISGTASTLGMERLSSLGRENEMRLKELISSGREIDSTVRQNITESIEMIERELNLINIVYNPKANGDLSRSYSSMSDMGKILLIDDDAAILKLLEGAFSSEGYEVFVCDDSLSAMDVIAVCKPDVILLDIMMPKCDGYEVLSQIKENPQYSDVFVIFLSAVDDIDNKVKGMKAGIDDYITKPFAVQEVVSRVEMILKRANKFKERLLKDDLTGAYSRHHFNERIKYELDRYYRYGTIFSAAFIDLDNFKNINDMYGHLAGDFLLQKFVAYMNKNLRGSDSLFRYGGEEFIVLLPDTDEEHAYTAMDRLRDGLSKQTLSFGGNELIITFSCGIKQVGEEDKTISKLLSSADEAMYSAKSSGKNMVKKFSCLIYENKRKRTVLLVDDERAILKLISLRMSELGYSIVLADSGQKAIDLTGQIHPDVIILDLILPDMDGLEVCSKIKSNPQTRNSRIIILSQKRGEKDIIKGLKCGADDYVTKPFSMGELEARVMRILNR